ncbi:hypothetical protein [Psychrobacter sp. 16-MNA-CIBAN-0192]|uniref:hypothetical protein n=1 Tax=Psychrobacter sp. 16-MNA-CIBAN-0192 TaxID=3140448 RepID=UPI0033277325
MSSYSFSHQFYQHWTHAPKLVRAAIVQELTDINTLLQPDTELADFSFIEPDLDAHIELLYDAHNTELAAAKAVADAQKLADEQRLVEESKKEDNRKAEEKKAQEEEDQKKEDAAAIEIQSNQVTTDDNDANNSNDSDSEIKSGSDDDSQVLAKSYEPAPTQEPQTTVNDNNHNDEETAETIQSKPSKGQVNSNKDKVLSALQQHASTDTVKPTPITDTLVNAPILNQDNEAFIHELGMHIDDYLSDQMAQLSEDLKSWLRAEISRKLSEQVSEQTSIASNSDNK